jgi:hypothetical protein
MTRLPTPGSDDGNWGSLLNAFLAVEHDASGLLTKLANLANLYEKTAGGITEVEFTSGVQAKLNTPPSTDVGDGTVTDAKVAVNAAIAQSKIANLTTVLATKLDINDPSLSDARTIIKLNGSAVAPAGVKRKNLKFITGTNAAINISDNDPRKATDTIIGRAFAAGDKTTWANVKDYGAVGNQATDCTAAFEAAIAYLKSKGGGALFVPRGTYLMSGAFNIEGIHLIGEGTGATVLAWQYDLGSSSTDVFAFDMQADGSPARPSSIQNLSIWGPSIGSWGVRPCWMHGVRASKGALFRDFAMSNFNFGVYLKYGQERFENIRITGCYYTIYYTGTTPDTGGQYFRNGEVSGAAFAAFVAAPNATIFNNVVTGVETGSTPFCYFKEGPPGGTFIKGLTLILYALEYIGNGMFYAPGQSIEDVTMLACGCWGMMQPGGYLSDYQPDAPVDCGTVRNWQILGQTPLNNSGEVGVFKCDNMINVGMDMTNDSTPKPLIVCPGTISNVEVRYPDLYMRPITTTTILQKGDLVQMEPNGKCSKCTNGIPIGINTSPNVAVSGQALICYEGVGNELPVAVRVAVSTGISRTSPGYLKPDPNNPGCAIKATGPQDGDVFATNISDVINGLVNCIPFGLA